MTTYYAYPGLKGHPVIQRTVTADHVISIVCDYFKVHRDRVQSCSRKRDFVEPRHIAFFLIRKHTSLYYQQVADIFLIKSHASVIHGEEVIYNRIKESASFRNIVNEIEGLI